MGVLQLSLASFPTGLGFPVVLYVGTIIRATQLVELVSFLFCLLLLVAFQGLSVLNI